MDESVLEDVLVSAWSGLSPYIMPILIIAALITFRVWFAEIIAEILYVFKRKLDYLHFGRVVISGYQQAMLSVWSGICLWKKKHRKTYGVTEDAVACMNDASMELITVLELGLPFFDEELRSVVEDIIRECVREQQIWQGSKEKSEAFLRDCQAAFDKIENKISTRLMPTLEKKLRN